MTQYVDAEALLADVRRKKKRTDEVARRARAKLGVRTGSTRRELRPISAEQRAAAFRAKRGPLGWVFVGSSPEEVIADSTTLRKIAHIYKVRPYMRHSGRCEIHLPSGKTVKFNARTGEVVRP